MTHAENDMRDGGRRDPAKETGLRCPRCNCGHFYVLWTRHRERSVRRRRECRNCGHQITTNETRLGEN